MKYRRKPVVIEAVQFLNEDGTGNTIRECMAFIGDKGEFIAGNNQIAIKTLEGVMWAINGDYIIKGIAGEFYPCKLNIFEKTYEKIEE